MICHILTTKKYLISLYEFLEAMKPYVGITGPVSVDETRDICKEFSDSGYSMSGEHIPMLGFLVSYKTLSGRIVSNRRYPPAREVPELLKATKGKVLTMIHYNSKMVSSLSEQVDYLFKGIYSTGLCRAMQLNIPWPDTDQVGEIMKKHPEMQIVLQLSQKAMDGKTPQQVAKGVKRYGSSISYTLIDPSGGRGIPFDLEHSVDVFSEVKSQCPDLMIGFAGGFDGTNVAPRLKDIIQQTGEKEFCIDAEGGLRDKVSDAYGDDILNMNKVRAYLQESSKVL